MVASKRNTWAKRGLKLLLPVLIVVDAALVRSGLLDLRGAIILIIGIEAIIGLSLIAGVTLLVVRRRRKRAAPLDAWSTLEEALEVFLPRPLAKVAVFEPRLFSYLLRWVFRRNRPEEGEFSYHRRSNLWLWPAMALFLTPIELLLFELLVPWSWLRWVLLIAAIYALLWVCGLHASFVLLRHRLEDGGGAASLRCAGGRFCPVLGDRRGKASMPASPRQTRWSAVFTPGRRRICGGERYDQHRVKAPRARGLKRGVSRHRAGHVRAGVRRRAR